MRRLKLIPVPEFLKQNVNAGVWYEYQLGSFESRRFGDANLAALPGIFYKTVKLFESTFPLQALLLRLEHQRMSNKPPLAV